MGRKLAELKRICAARARAQPAEGEVPAGEMVRQYLRGRGIEQDPTESSAETLARALGIRCPELRERLSA